VDKAYLEDLAPGQVFTSEARAVVDARSIKRFAGEFDPQPFHLDEATAQPTFFKKQRMAHDRGDDAAPRQDAAAVAWHHRQRCR